MQEKKTAIEARRAMIILLTVYLLFQIAFDHWAQDNSLWWAVYYSFQYGWIAAIAAYYFFTTKKIVYMFLAFPFLALAGDEWLAFIGNAQPWEMSSLPVLNLTLFAGALFILYEIIQWRKRRSALRGRI